VDSSPAVVTSDPGSRIQTRLSKSEAISDISPKNAPTTKYNLVLLSKEVKDLFCCGVITSNKNNYTCAKASKKCNIVSHTKKHEEVIVNHVYILMYSTSQVNFRRLYNLSKFKNEVAENDIGQVFQKIITINKNLDLVNADAGDAMEAFRNLISDIIESKYASNTSVHSSEEGSEKNMLAELIGELVLEAGIEIEESDQKVIVLPDLTVGDSSTVKIKESNVSDDRKMPAFEFPIEAS
jgi:hypothetical protein